MRRTTQRWCLGATSTAAPRDLEMAMLRWLLPELRDSWASLHPDDPGYTSNAEDQGKGGLHSSSFQRDAAEHRVHV